MRAMIRERYGSSGVLELKEVDTPVPGDDEVLVRVRAASVQPYDWHHMRGEPYIARLMGGDMGLRGPKFPILGGGMAGEVAAAGKSVTEFGPGDEVFAMPKMGGFAEYAP